MTASLPLPGRRGSRTRDADEPTAARLWVIEVLTQYERLAHDVVHHAGTPIQAYCDLLEVRWLLSERAGHDVGINRALAALARDVIATDSAAKMAVAEVSPAPPATTSHGTLQIYVANFLESEHMFEL